MAVTRRRSSAQAFNPRWPDLSTLSMSDVRITFDRPVDTLFVDFHGKARPAASVPLDRGDRDYLFLRVDPETEDVVGLQIEHFLSYAVDRHPELVHALDLADLAGIDREELRRITNIDSAHRKTTEPSAIIEELLRLSA